jgi:peptidoglycan/LPS O-acetylase OafA/YrhL
MDRAQENPSSTSPVAEVGRASTESVARLRGLDGLRAIAVIAVFLFHADISWACGGYLGVDLFFVISGFLITSLLLREIKRTGKLSLGQFYLRRARRLLPASLLMTVATVIAAAVFAPDALPRLRADAIASFFYLTNWELIIAGRSYFEFIGRQPFLLHLWSLAIEEQYYIVWAPVVLLCIPRFRTRNLAIAAALAAVASITWMAVLASRTGHPVQGDPTRLYFGTDTHGFSLLIGSVLGLLWRPGRASNPISPPTNEGLFIVGGLALLALFILFARLDETTPWLYPWGLLSSDVASVALIVAATYSGAYFGRWLDSQPLRWIGERSYGIYLWHWPIFMLTRPDFDLQMPSGSIFLIRVVLTLVLSAASYRFVETPIRNGAVDRFIVTLLSRKRWAHDRYRVAREFGTAFAAAAAMACMAAILIAAPKQTLPAPEDLAAMGLNAQGKPLRLTSAIKPIAAPISAKSQEQNGASQPSNMNQGSDLTAIGDSVLLGSSRMLMRTLPGSKVYATVGWQAANVVNQIQLLRDAHALTTVVLIHLGTNGYVTEDQLRTMLGLLSDRKLVLLMNTHVPRRWMDPNNDLIDSVLSDYPNVVLVDWKNASNAHREYFVSDGVHPNIVGQKILVAAIVKAGHFAVAPPPEKKLTASNVAPPGGPAVDLSGDDSKSLERYPRPIAPESFWLAIARCETGTNWKNGGRFSGGLGIYVGSWKAWGGLDFGPAPADATPEQQVIVADRISTQGWIRPNGSMQAPVGFSGWGCVRSVGQPQLLSYTKESVLAQQFHWLQHGRVVHDLQLLMDVPTDSIYGKLTRVAHVGLLTKLGRSLNLAALAP